MLKEEILRIWHSRNNLTSPGRPFFSGDELPIADNKKTNVFFTKECVLKHIMWNKCIFSAETGYDWQRK